MGKFKKGLFLGGLLGATLTWMNTTKEGKEMRKKLEAWSREAFDELSEKISESDLADRVKYDARVQVLMEEFSKKKKLTAPMRKKVEKILKAQWKRLQKK